ncbi:beta-propeller fold lactonase family protein [Variovorax paradoxus]|uniref:beta-propeller fold lactonase family protein n=1 Tax=Variovorax paradoxus TaxID=34073 RepID=UPI003D65A581
MCGRVDVEVDPTEQFLYVVNRDENDMTTFVIDPATGALKMIRLLKGTKVFAR